MCRVTRKLCWPENRPNYLEISIAFIQEIAAVAYQQLLNFDNDTAGNVTLNELLKRTGQMIKSNRSTRD